MSSEKLTIQKKKKALMIKKKKKKKKYSVSRSTVCLVAEPQ